MPDFDEASFILRRAQAAGLHETVYGAHLANRVPILNYIRIASEIKKTVPNGRILDWGCGAGQMSFLLQRRGLAVESYDVSDRVHKAPSPVFTNVLISHGDDPVHLLYPDATFDAVLSCGVLEHVADEAGSLAEIHRVLRDDGLFFIYNLPQSGSYKEFFLSKFHLGYTHERKYTLASAVALLGRAQLPVLRAQRSGMLPQNLTPFPQLRGFYNHTAPLILLLDRVLSAIPLLNSAAEALELIAMKRAIRK